MNIFDYAMNMERDGRKFFQKLADSAPDEGVRSIFEMLVQDEDRHLKALEEVAEREYDMGDTEVLPTAKNIFNFK